MKPATNTLTDIFNADVRYVVPLYQRPYVWTEDGHWEPLWDDILVVLNHYRTGDGEPIRHFLGAIVLDQQLTAPGQPSQRLVIDGQQRLTTLQLLLAAVVRAAVDDGRERQARLLRRLIQNDPDLSAGDALFKVWPTNANQAAFRDVMAFDAVIGPIKDDPNNTIHEAYEFFRRCVAEWVHEDDPGEDEIGDRYEALRVVLSSLLQVVSINLEDGDNAQVIFETLNARGTPLLALDLVKNALFYRADREGADVEHLNSNIWEPELDRASWRQTVRQGRLNRPRAELFLMHWLTMRLARTVPATELFSQFRSHVLDAPAAPDIEQLVREFCRDAGVMRDLEARPAGTPEGDFFARLQAVDTTTVLPIVLLLYTSIELDDNRRRTGLAAIESWLVRRMLTGGTIRNYNKLMIDLIKRLRADITNADSVIVNFLRGSDAASAAWPRDHEVTKFLTTHAMYGWVGQPRIVVALAAIELGLRRANKVEDIYALPPDLTIEHVIPQDWAENWPSPDAEASESRQAHVDLLGNLTLTSGSLNSSMRNAAWDDKRPALSANSVLLLNREITDHATWDEADIDARGQKLAERICRIWRGPEHPGWPSGTPEPAGAETSA